MASIIEETHDAMATTFGFRLACAEPAYARKAAKEAFGLVDRLEGLLSRFREGSDVWRINHAEGLVRLSISEETHRCLLLGLEMMELTGGAFDMTMGSAADLARRSKGTPLDSEALRQVLEQRSSGVFRIDPDLAQVEVGGFKGALDLGAIGKGFALDYAAEFFGQWDIGCFLLNGGGSSVLVASESEPWSLNLCGQKQRVVVRIMRGALGASGTSVRGGHIINAFGADQHYHYVRSWAVAPSAAEADALSTAWMTLEKDQITTVLAQAGSGYAAIVEEASGRILFNESGGEWIDTADRPEGLGFA